MTPLSLGGRRRDDLGAEDPRPQERRVARAPRHGVAEEGEGAHACSSENLLGYVVYRVAHVHSNYSFSASVFC